MINFFYFQSNFRAFSRFFETPLFSNVELYFPLLWEQTSIQPKRSSNWCDNGRRRKWITRQTESNREREIERERERESEKRKKKKERRKKKEKKKKVVDNLLFGWETQPTNEAAVESGFTGHRTAREQMMGKCRSGARPVVTVLTLEHLTSIQKSSATQ